MRANSKSLHISAWSRFSRAVFLCHVAVLLLLAPAVRAERAPAAPLADRVASVSIVVSDMDRSIDFYSHILTFAKVSDVEIAGNEVEHLQGVFGVRMRIVKMRLGEESIELTEFLAPQGRPMPVDSRANDGWFQHIAIIVTDMDRAYALLRRNNVRLASTGPQLLPPYIKNAAGIRAFYFRDPDSHFLEILEFPQDKGDARWHRSGDKLFLGIDHTAIVVNDTEKSLLFYRDVLGMHIAGESENYGTEQEHLNNVFGARLRITSLHAAAGPGIELLEYLAPRDGRPMPVDSQPNDSWAWKTTLTTPDASALSHWPGSRYPLVSSGTVTLPDDTLGFRSGVLVRDPDGHLMQLVTGARPN